MTLLLAAVFGVYLAPETGLAQRHPPRLFVEGDFGFEKDYRYGAGVGYAFLGGHDLSVRVLTGPDTRDGLKADFNIGSVQWRGTFMPSASLSPTLELGYGLVSLFGAPYYNGHGFQAAAGVRWWFTTYCDVSLRAIVARTWFHQRGNPRNAKPSFTDERLWGMLSIGFAPGL